MTTKKEAYKLARAEQRERTKRAMEQWRIELANRPFVDMGTAGGRLRQSGWRSVDEVALATDVELLLGNNLGMTYLKQIRQRIPYRGAEEQPSVEASYRRIQKLLEGFNAYSQYRARRELMESWLRQAQERVRALLLEG